MGGNKHLLTIVEGRQLNQRMANEAVRMSRKVGLDAKILKTLDSDKVATGDFSDVFSDMVWWRGLESVKTTYEAERAISWINQQPRIISINTDVTGGRACTSDKYYQHGLFILDDILREHVLPCRIAGSIDELENEIKDGKLSFPFVLKPDFGTMGQNIVLIRDMDSLKKCTGNFSNYSTEPFVKSTYDWRVFVLGGFSLGVMRKIGDPKDEANFYAKSGGRQRWGETNREVVELLSQLATRAAVISGLDYCGVDFIRDDKTGKFYILETNYSGGWQNGFTNATGVNVPTEVAKWFLDRALMFEESTKDAVKTYIENRLKFISEESQKLYHDVVEYKFNTKMSIEIARIGIRIQENSLLNKLLAAYTLVLGGELEPEIRGRIQDLLYLVENYEISRFGNYVGKGSLEEMILGSALYVAVASRIK